MIDGVTSRPFSATTLPPITPLVKNFRKEIIDMSRKTFARPRADVENDIMLWHQEMQGSTESSAGVKKSKPSTSERKSPIDLALEAVMGKSQTSTTSTVSSSSQTNTANTSVKIAPKPDNKENKVVVPTRERDSNEREKDLRKAVSLSYLRQNNTKPKEKKVPSEKNLADLRQALSSVVDIPKGGQTSAQTTAHTTHTTQTGRKENTSHSSSYTHRTEERRKTTYSDVEREEKKAPPKEVPEDILKKILEI